MQFIQREGHFDLFGGFFLEIFFMLFANCIKKTGNDSRAADGSAASVELTERGFGAIARWG